MGGETELLQSVLHRPCASFAQRVFRTGFSFDSQHRAGCILAMGNQESALKPDASQLTFPSLGMVIEAPKEAAT